MPSDSLPEIIVKYKGTFHQEGLYQRIYDWLIHQGYEVHEGKHKHKMGNLGGEQEVKWEGSRKLNHFIKYIIKIEYKFWELKPVEVRGEHMTYGRFHVVLNASFEMDYNSRFSKAGLSGLFAFFMKFIYLKDVDIIYADSLYYEVYRLHRAIKEYLDMETQTNAFEGR